MTAPGDYPKEPSRCTAAIVDLAAYRAGHKKPQPRQRQAAQGDELSRRIRALQNRSLYPPQP